MNTKTPLYKGILLVAGTSIGGGMLALPVFTALTGFLPSVVIYFLCWLFMAATGLLLLEVCFWLEKDSNLISMAQHTLGPIGKIAAWGLYLFLFYCLTLAYIDGGGGLFTNLLGPSFPAWFGPLLFVTIFAPMTYAGAHFVGKINVWLMTGLIISYLAFVFLGYRYVNFDLLAERDWSQAITTLPIAFIAFAYQGIIPTLTTYMNRDVKRLRLVILIGSFIPFITYVIWQALILGIVPLHAPGGLADALAKGENAVTPLKHFIQNPTIYVIGQFFAFFALITSFFGVTLGLLDFLSDGLGVEKTPKGRLLLCTLLFGPTLLIALTYPNLFLIALDYAGGFGCSLLLGLLPILMVWVGRYKLRLKSEYSLFGGKIVLSLLLAFVLIELAAQFYLLSK